MKFVDGNVLLREIDAAIAVPEAATWAMMLLGFGGLGFAAFRTRKGAAVALAA